MEVGITLTKLNEKILATVKEVDGERYFCLAEILEQLHLKGGFNEKSIPVEISGKIIYSFRTSDCLNLLETVFIDESSAKKLIEEHGGE